MNPSSTPFANLDGIDWVVFAGTFGDAPQAASIASGCHQAEVPFHFYRIDSPFVEPGPCDTSPDPAIDGAVSMPNHPFGRDVRMHRPTLSALRDSQPQMSNLASSGVLEESATSTASAPLPIPMTSAELSIAPSESHVERPAVEPAVEPTEVPAEIPAEVPAEVPTEVPAASPENEPDPVQSEEAADAPNAEHLDFEVVGPDLDPIHNPASEADVGDFNRLDQVVCKGLDTFIEVGRALAEINLRDLWRAGGHPSWAAYCLAHGLTKIHANRLIRGSALATRLAEVKPAGFTQSPICPRSEWQIRPLHRLQDAKQQDTAWLRAAERAGGQPTEQGVLAEVSEIIGNRPTSASPKPSRKQLIVDAIRALREAVSADRPKQELELRIAELETRLQIA